MQRALGIFGFDYPEKNKWDEIQAAAIEGVKITINSIQNSTTDTSPVLLRGEGRASASIPSTEEYVEELVRWSFHEQ